MRISLLSLLVAFTLFACNRDAAEATQRANSTLPAPASAPNQPPAVKAMGQEAIPAKAAVDPAFANDVPDTKGQAEMTEADYEAASRLGPAKGAGIPQAATNVQRAPGNGNMAKKPAVQPAPDLTDKPALDYGRPVVTLAKSACHSGSRCRQFTISLTADRRLILEPKWNMDLKGTHVRQLSAAEYRELTAAMEATEPANLQSTYPADMSTVPADLQSTALTFADVYGAPKRVSFHQQGPEEAIEFMALLEAWVDKDGWKRMVP